MGRPLSRLGAWLRTATLPPWPAALVGALAGLAVGLAITINMRRHAVFTEPYQDLTAGAALMVLWLCIGAVAGLAVLSPVPAEPDGPPDG
jgi:ABC-type lipoprotein release transport system permease subunit